MTQLRELSKPFAEKLVERKPGNGGGDYVTHSVVTEKALATVGPYSLENVELIRGFANEEITGKGKASEKVYPARDGVVVGALVTICCEVDGRTVRITEAGDVENPLQKGNDGARAKDAISDGVKRCWMRLGLGLHLWSQEHYVLDKVLERNEKAGKQAEERPVEPEINSVQTPTQPPKEEPKLSHKRADAMLRELDKMGFSEDDTLELVAEVVRKGVVKLTELTEGEGIQVWNVARRRPAKPVEVKPPYEAWGHDSNARTWAAEMANEYGIFRGGHELQLLFDEVKARNPENLHKTWYEEIMQRVDASKQKAA